ncbi:MAG: ROK family protein, partial [Spirochaetales bacterium]|nr:ROK family protein [Spirochaetales bacterium]
MQNILAGIDVGGTYTKIGIVDTENMQILKEKTIPTEEYYNSTNCLNRIIDSILELCLDIKISIDDLEGIGFGILGPVINNKKIVPVRGFHWEDVVDLEKEINK